MRSLGRSVPLRAPCVIVSGPKVCICTYQPIGADIESFVNGWSQRYLYAEEHLYNGNIGYELTELRILDLCRWKNGALLSDKKCNSVQ
jgi:hypothetical protein